MHPEQKSKKSCRTIASYFLKVGAIVFLLFGTVYFVYHTLHPPLPNPKNPLLFYSNQTGDDLKRVIQSAIRKTKKSLLLQIYGCTDPDLIAQIQQASEKGIQVDLLYDESGSGPLRKKIPQAVALTCSGLMHKKILVLDDQNVFIGTANLTPTSLTMHDNVIIGFHHKELAHFIRHGQEQSFSFTSANQPATLWHLPDFHNRCLNTLLKHLAQAQTSIRLCLFTFTHPKIIQELIYAKNRGVDVQVALDYYTSRGASQKAAQQLLAAQIPLHLSKGEKLLHHKWCVIDEKTLFLGSANWTKSAFTKNEDCLIQLDNLTEKQKIFFLTIWKDIQKNSQKSCVL